MFIDVFRRIDQVVHRPVLRNILGGVFILGSLSYLGYVLFNNWGELTRYDWRIDCVWVVLAFLFYSVALFTVVIGWSWIMKRISFSAHETRLPKHLKYYIYSNLCQRLPAPALYLLGRAYLYESEGVTKTVTVAISILEWLILTFSGVIVYLVLSPFSSLPSPGYNNYWILAGVIILSSLLIHPRIIQLILRFRGQEEIAPPFNYVDVWISLFIYSLVWILGGLTLYTVINSIYPLSLGSLSAVISVWALSGSLTTVILIAIPGFGIKEVTLSFLLGYLMPSPLAIVVSLLMRVCLTVFEIFWGIVAVILKE